MEIGLWDEEMRVDIVVNKGSVQEIARIPPKIRELYKTVWEISQKVRKTSVIRYFLHI